MFPLHSMVSQQQSLYHPRDENETQDIILTSVLALPVALPHSGALRNGQRLLVEILFDTYCTITPMRINIAQALNNSLIALYFSSQLLI